VQARVAPIADCDIHAVLRQWQELPRKKQPRSGFASVERLDTVGSVLRFTFGWLMHQQSGVKSDRSCFPTLTLDRPQLIEIEEALLVAPICLASYIAVSAF